MSPLNRREFIYCSFAVSTTAALEPHLLAVSPDLARQPGISLSQEVRKGWSIQPQFERDGNVVVNWREQGLNFSANAVRNRHSFR